MGQRNSSSFKNADALFQPFNKQYFKLQWRNLKSKMKYEPGSISVPYRIVLSFDGFVTIGGLSYHLESAWCPCFNLFNL